MGLKQGERWNWNHAYGRGVPASGFANPPCNFVPCPFCSRGALHLFSRVAERCCPLAGGLLFLDAATQSLPELFLQLFALPCFSSLLLQGTGVNPSSNRYNSLAFINNKLENSSPVSAYLVCLDRGLPSSHKISVDHTTCCYLGTE